MRLLHGGEALVRYVRQVRLVQGGLPLMGIDPGESTGVAFGWLREGKLWNVAGGIVSTFRGEREELAIEELLKLAETLESTSRGAGIRVAIEDFRSTRADLSDAFLSPVRVGRPLGWGMKERRLLAEPVRWYSAGRKAEYKDERLRAMGLWVAGPDHVRDATRHLLILRKQLVAEGVGL